MDSFARYARSRLPELAFLVLASSALFSTLSYGFHVEDSLRTAYPALLGWTALWMVSFTACSYSLRTVAVGVPALLVAALVCVTAASAACGFSIFDDAYGNLGFFLLLGVLTAALSYLLTRKRALAVLYLLAGVLVCAFIQFLYRNSLLVQLLLFAVCAAALLVWSMQRESGSELAQGAVSAPVSLLTGAGLCCVALLVSGALYAGVVAPLQPPTHELKLITRYYALEEVPVSGVSKLQHLQNEELLSQNGVEGDDTTNQTDSREEEVNGLQGDESQGSIFNGFDTPLDAMRYFVEHPLWLLVIPGLALVVLAAIGVKQQLRKRRYKSICAQNPKQQLQSFYFFFERRLRRFGIEFDPALTPVERARASAQACSIYEAGAQGGSFQSLAEDYCGVAYGAAEPGESALENCRKLYSVFYKNACRSVGRIKYAFTKFFLI